MKITTDEHPENGTDYQPSKYQQTTKTLKKFIMSKLQLLLTMFGVLSGFGLGFLLKMFQPLSSSTLLWIGLPGQLFLQLLRMSTIPVMSSSIICATARSDALKSGMIGALVFGLIGLNNLIGIVLGIILTISIKPGATDDLKDSNMNSDILSSSSSKLLTEDIIADLIRNMIPPNLVQVTLQKAQTIYKPVTLQGIDNENLTAVTHERVVTYVNDMNLLGLIAASMLFGIAAGKLGDRAAQFRRFFEALFEVTLLLLKWFLWSTPIGVCSLIAITIATIEDLDTVFIKLGFFVATVCSGLAIQQIVMYPVMAFLTAKQNPLQWITTNARIWFIAFSAQSSFTCMAEMFHVCQKKYRLHNEITSLSVPLGTTFTGAGSALFAASAVFFIAQMNGVVVSVAQAVIVVLIIWVSALALPGVPSASIVVVIISSSSISLNVEYVGLLFVVEWLLDRIRTPSNSLAVPLAALLIQTIVNLTYKQSDQEEHKQPDDREVEATLV